MYDAESVKQLYHQLEARVKEATNAERYIEAANIATALEKLKAWNRAGRPGELPAEVRELPGITLPTPGASAAASSVPDSAPAAAATSGVAPDGALVSGFADALAAAAADSERGRFAAAQARLDTLQTTVSNEAEQRALRGAQQELNQQHAAALESALAQARAAQARGASVPAQRIAWEAVQGIAPDLPEAVDALRVLKTLESARGSLEQLIDIQRRMGEIEKDINEINKARRVVEGLLYDKALVDAGLKPEVELLLGQLNERRDYVQTIFFGATSAVKSGALEEALKKFRQAFREGFKKIYDDETGELVDVETEYVRVRSQYFQLQVWRTEERFNEAKSALAKGAPEVAISRLEDALQLLGKVEDQSGTDWRKRVEDLLNTARQEKEGKQQAETWIEKARAAADARAELSWLQWARQAYPKFPEIGAEIAQAEEKILRIVLTDLAILLGKAQTSLGVRNFAEARSVGEQALRAGQEYDFIQNNDVYRMQRARVEELMRTIGEAEVQWQKMQAEVAARANKLQSQIDAIQSAVDSKNLSLARQLLDQIADADLADSRVINLSTIISVSTEEAQQEADAQKAFDDQRYEQVITICGRLQESGGIYATSAGSLLRRAQARLWSQQAAAVKEQGRREEANALYTKLLGLRGGLPADDAIFVQQAESALKAIAQERRDAERYEREFDALEYDRLYDRWEKWYQGLRALRQHVPDWFKPRIDEELSSGMADWRTFVLKEVKDRADAPEPPWQDIFEKFVNPLHRAGGIALATGAGPRDTEFVAEDELSVLYRQAAIAYYRQQAAKWEKSTKEEDVERAYEFRRNVYNLAPQPAMQEREEMVTALRLLVTTQARNTAASEGPTAAVKKLAEQIQRYESDLKADATLHQEQIYYALLARDFETASRKADGMQYLYPRGRARGWRQLVDALAVFFSASDQPNREQGVRELTMLRDTLTTRPRGGATDGEERLAAIVEEFAMRLADALHTELPSGGHSLSNEEVLQSVHIYDLILQLHKDDRRAYNGVQQLADRLNQIGEDLVVKAQAQIGERGSADRDVRQMEALNHELRAILQAYALLSQSSTPRGIQLARFSEQVRQQIQLQSDLLQLLDTLQQAWERTLSTTWDVKPLRALLEGGQAATRRTQTNDLADWESRVAAAEETLARLKARLKQIGDAWEEEDFTLVIEDCEQFDDSLQRARKDLGRDLILPPELFAVNDKMARQPLTSLDEVRRIARNKQQNLTHWTYWMSVFQAYIDKARSAQEAAEKYLETTPPCLTDGRNALTTLLQQYRALVRHLETKPKDVLSKKADKLTEQVHESDLKTMVEQEISAGEARLIEVEQRLQLQQDMLDDLSQEWERAIKSTWEIQPVRRLLESAHRLNQCGPVSELAEWESRVILAEEILGRLKNSIRFIEDAWEVKDFEGVIKQSDRLENDLVSAKRDAIRELVLPENLLVIRDEHARANLATLAEVRRSARNRLQDLAPVLSFFVSAGFEVHDHGRHDSILVPQDTYNIRRLGTNIYMRVQADRVVRGEDIEELVRTIRTHYQEQLSGRVAFVVLDRPPDYGARLQMFTYRVSENFTIVPLSFLQVRQALQTGLCSAALASVLEDYLGETDLYKAHQPVSDVLGFFGRKKTIDTIQNILNRGEHVALMGLRKMGKTSLVDYQCDELPYPMAVLSLQDVHKPVEIFRDAVAKWSRSLSLRFPDIVIPDLNMTSREIVSDIETAFRTDVQTLIELLERRETSQRLVLCLDEIDEIVPSHESSAETIRAFHDLMGFLRGIAKRFGAFSMIVCGMNSDINRVSYWKRQSNPVFQFFHEIFLCPFSKEENDEMVQSIGTHMGVTYESDALDLLYLESGGHPYIARQICSAAVAKAPGRPYTFGANDIESAAREYLHDPRTVVYVEQELWGTLHGQGEKEILIALARHQPQTEAELAQIAVSKPRQLAQRTDPAHLSERWLLKADANGYSIPYDCFRRWIRMNFLGEDNEYE